MVLNMAKAPQSPRQNKFKQKKNQNISRGASRKTPTETLATFQNEEMLQQNYIRSGSTSAEELRSLRARYNL